MLSSLTGSINYHVTRCQTLICVSAHPAPPSPTPAACNKAIISEGPLARRMTVQRMEWRCFYDSPVSTKQHMDIHSHTRTNHRHNDTAAESKKQTVAARNPRAAILGEKNENEISFHCLSAATFLAQYKQLVNWQFISFLVLVEGWMAPWILKKQFCHFSFLVLQYKAWSGGGG